jgi:hypothetical protein
MTIHHDPVISYGHVELASSEKRQDGESKDDFFARCAEQVYGKGRLEFVGFGKFRRRCWVYEKGVIMAYDQHTRLAMFSRLADLLVYGDRSDDGGYTGFELCHQSQLQELRRSYGFWSVYKGQIQLAACLLLVIAMVLFAFYCDHQYRFSRH